jgi:hypothetical protein
MARGKARRPFATGSAPEARTRVSLLCRWRSRSNPRGGKLSGKSRAPDVLSVQCPAFASAIATAIETFAIQQSLKAVTACGSEREHYREGHPRRRTLRPDTTGAAGTASTNRRTSGTRSESRCQASAMFHAASGMPSS